MEFRLWLRPYIPVPVLTPPDVTNVLWQSMYYGGNKDWAVYSCKVRAQGSNNIWNGWRHLLILAPTKSFFSDLSFKKITNQRAYSPLIKNNRKFLLYKLQHWFFFQPKLLSSSNGNTYISFQPKNHIDQLHLIQFIIIFHSPRERGTIRPFNH